MNDAPAAVVLAAGAGTRLRPLTDIRPKALCPVANVPLLDHAWAAVRSVASRVAVNAHAHADQVVAHLADADADDVHVVVEAPEALGTAGALGNLRDWIDGRAVIVHNADAWHRGDVATALLDGWDGERCRLLVVPATGKGGGDFGPWRYAGVCVLPWSSVRSLKPEPAGLYEVLWRDEHERGRLDLVPHDGPWFDCGTPSDYLAANLCASGGLSVVGAGAVVAGELVRSVVWPGGVVAAGERLVECIRAGADVTVHAPQPAGRP